MVATSASDRGAWLGRPWTEGPQHGLKGQAARKVDGPPLADGSSMRRSGKQSVNVAVDPYAHFETMRTRGLSDGTGLSEVILEAEAWCA